MVINKKKKAIPSISFLGFEIDRCNALYPICECKEGWSTCSIPFWLYYKSLIRIDFGLSSHNIQEDAIVDGWKDLFESNQVSLSLSLSLSLSIMISLNHESQYILWQTIWRAERCMVIWCNTQVKITGGGHIWKIQTASLPKGPLCTLHLNIQNLFQWANRWIGHQISHKEAPSIFAL